ncbi:MAG TPA: hypothetical protein VGK50_08050 [Coriobacteriia bacterium]|jgi:hypothetical protein
MNISLGARLRDGRRVGIEWRRRRTAHGTVVHASLRHEGELSAEDLERCLAEIAEGERLAESVRGSRPRQVHV